MLTVVGDIQNRSFIANKAMEFRYGLEMFMTDRAEFQEFYDHITVFSTSRPG
jgi:hypothetical protein